MPITADPLAHNWWAIALRGLCGVIFGLVTFFAPGISLAALVLLYGAYAFVDGVFALVSAIRSHRPRERWFFLVLEGIVGVAAGVVTLLWPGITAIALLFVIAAWAVVTGAFEVAAAIRLRKVIEHEWLLALSGVASIALGVFLVLYPGAGALALVLWIGAYALVSGALLIGLAFRLRTWDRTHTPHAAHAMA